MLVSLPHSSLAPQLHCIDASHLSPSLHTSLFRLCSTLYFIISHTLSHCSGCGCCWWAVLTKDSPICLEHMNEVFGFVSAQDANGACSTFRSLPYRSLPCSLSHTLSLLLAQIHSLSSFPSPLEMACA